MATTVSIKRPSKKSRVERPPKILESRKENDLEIVSETDSSDLAESSDSTITDEWLNDSNGPSVSDKEDSPSVEERSKALPKDHSNVSKPTTQTIQPVGLISENNNPTTISDRVDNNNGNSDLFQNTRSIPKDSTGNGTFSDNILSKSNSSGIDPKSIFNIISPNCIVPFVSDYLDTNGVRMTFKSVDEKTKYYNGILLGRILENLPHCFGFKILVDQNVIFELFKDCTSRFSQVIKEQEETVLSTFCRITRLLSHTSNKKRICLPDDFH